MPLARAKLLPHAVARFHAAHPEVQIDIVDGQQAGLTEQLREGDLDFLVGALPYSSPGKGIEQKWLFDDPLVVIARADHPLVDGRSEERRGGKECVSVFRSRGWPMH